MILNSTSPNTSSSTNVPVTLIVWETPPAVSSVMPASLFFTAKSGDSAPAQELRVDSASAPVVFSLRLQTDGFGLGVGPGGNPLLANPLITPASLPVTVTASPDLSPGIHHGSITIVSPGAEVSVPVTFEITPGPFRGTSSPPVLGTIVSAGSERPGPIAPGELVAIHGVGVGPQDAFGLTLDSGGKVVTVLHGVRVLFDGVPAPIVYSSIFQTNIVVPYDVAGQAATTIEAEYNGVRSAAFAVPIAQEAPAILTIDGSGQGRAAVLNEDSSINDSSNPADVGSVVQIYATGEGLTSPQAIYESPAAGERDPRWH